MKTASKCIMGLCVIALIAGCQNTGDGSSWAGDDPCNLLMGGIVGGLLGAVVDSKSRGRGALIGAGAGALVCVAFNAASRQTRTAQQVEDDYKKRNGNKLPSAPAVESYNVKVNDSIRPGEKTNIVSTMTVVRGANEPVNEVKEALTIGSGDNKRSSEKIVNENPESGAYENTFAVTFPKDMAPGAYPISTKLYVNGKPMQERKQNLKVIALNGERQYMLTAAAE